MSNKDLKGSTPESSTGSADGLVSQRSENSVLFSLNNLTAINDNDASHGAGYASGGGALGGADKSGLIDLNTLARLGAGSATGGGDTSTGSAAAAPALFNVGARRSNKGLMIGIAFLVIVVLGLGGTLTYLMVFKAEEPKPAVAEAEPEEKDPAAEAGVDPDTIVTHATARRVVDVPDEPEEDEEEKRKAEEAARAAEEAAAAAKAAEASRRSSDRGSRRDDKKSGGDSGEAASESKPRSSGSGPDPKAVRGVLDGSQARAKKCGKEGDIVVQFNLMPSGKTSGVKAAGGSLMGTPTERCVLGVVERLEFPSFSGSATPIKYSYKL